MDYTVSMWDRMILTVLSTRNQKTKWLHSSQPYSLNSKLELRLGIFFSSLSIFQENPNWFFLFWWFQRLYNEGARNLWIHGMGPLGCLARIIATFGKDASKLDQFGCVNSHNRAAKLFNSQLHSLCAKLGSQLPQVNVTYVDIFAIKLNLIANFSQLGKFFEYLKAGCRVRKKNLHAFINCTKILRNGFSLKNI